MGVTGQVRQADEVMLENITANNFLHCGVRRFKEEYAENGYYGVLPLAGGRLQGWVLGWVLDGCRAGSDNFEFEFDVGWGVETIFNGAKAQGLVEATGAALTRDQRWTCP